MNLQQALLDNDKLVTVKSYDFHGQTLYLAKYKRKVFYDNLWNPELELFRGLVFDSEYNIVQLPFTKIYNEFEPNVDVFESDEIVTAYRKINGFMVAMTSYNGQILVTTTGSIEGPFSQLARDYLTPQIEQVIHNEPEYTFLFECCHPSDPHIIPEYPGLYFLGARKKQFDSLVWVPNHLFPPSVVNHPTKLVGAYSNIYHKAMTADHEGYVIYSADRKRSTKVKSKLYLMHKALARASADKLSRLRLDEEFRDLSIATRTPEFIAMDEQQRLTFIRNFYA